MGLTGKDICDKIIAIRKKNMQERTILTCDPSFTAWGWVIISMAGDIIDSGCIKTSPSHKKLKIRKGDDRCRRISEINQTLLGLIKKHNVIYIISEQPHGSQNAAAAVMIGITLGIVQTIADVLTLGVEWTTEGDCKKCLLGKRSAAKGEVVEAIKERYPMVPFVGTKYIDEAVADAMAVYHYGKQNSNILRIMCEG